jgi:hypothetical protein
MGSVVEGGNIDDNTWWKVFHFIKTNLIILLLKAWSDAAAANGSAVTASSNERNVSTTHWRT